MSTQAFVQQIYQLLLSHSSFDFEELALEVFHYQSHQNPVYKRYLQLLGTKSAEVKHLSQIPFMPIELFKYHPVICHDCAVQIIFKSSGTTSTSLRSQHLVHDKAFYQHLSKKIFTHHLSLDWEHLVVMAYVPSYHENPDSSLLFMLQTFIEATSDSLSGFYSFEPDRLLQNIQAAQAKGKMVVLFGVTYALLQLAQTHATHLHNVIVYETGGMKGRGEEKVREEIHDLLKQQFGLSAIGSEYGMTELLSQFYSHSEGVFQPVRSARVFVRTPEDPFDIRTQGRGAINIVDLANVATCSFIATDDVGEILPDGTFKINGRLDTAEIRGCNLLVASN